MLSSTKTIVYLDRNIIRVGQIKKNQLKNEKIIAENWQTQDLTEIFKKIRKKISKSVCLLLGEDLSYVLYEKIKLKQGEVLREALVQVVTENIPENIDNLDWRYKILAKSSEEITVQVVAFVTDIYQQIKEAIKAAGLKVEKTTTVSLAIASLLKNDDKPGLSLYKSYDNLALVIYQSAVIGGKSLKTNDLEKELRELINWVKETYGLKVQKINKEKVNPMLGVPKINTMGEITGNQNKNQENNFSSNNKVVVKKLTTTSKRLILMLSLVVVLAIVLVVLLILKGWLPGFLQSKTNQELLSPQVEEINESSQNELVVSPSPSPVPVVLSDYSVQILNGNGVSGVAGEVVAILKAEGFVDLETANADNYDYTTTIVKIKAETPNQVFDNLERALNSDYNLELQSDSLTDSSKYDVIIILGTKK